MISQASQPEFESYVIFAGNKTGRVALYNPTSFESYVIFAGNKTLAKKAKEHEFHFDFRRICI